MNSVSVLFNLRWRARGGRSRMLAAALVVAAVIVFAIGQHRAARTPITSEAVAFVISSGFAALVLVLLAVGLLLGADSNDEMRKLRRIDRALRKEPLPDAWEVITRVQTAAGRSKALARGEGRPGDAHQVGIGPGTVIAVLGGCALIGGGWLRAARTAAVSQALGGAVLGFLGVAIIAGAVAAQDVRRQAHVDRSRSELLDSLPLSKCAVPERGDANHAKWTGPGLARCHRATCPALVTTTIPDERYRVDGRGLDVCDLCHPEGA